MAVDHYRTLADDYEWLESDAVHSGEEFLAQTADLLGALPPGARVLDCACGNGSTALGLARAGFDTHASDLSPAMVARTRERAEAEGLLLPAEVGDWASLRERAQRPFDLVICVGNSIVHADGRAGRREALAAMRAVLAPAGRVLLDARNWEKLRAQRPRIVAERPVERGGRRCQALRVWSIPEDWEAVHVQEPVLLFDAEDGAPPRVRRYEVPFVPVRREDLAADLVAVGLDALQWRGVEENEDWYAVVAQPSR
jgi:SAM-dependent methyltransferase